MKRAFPVFGVPAFLLFLLPALWAQNPSGADTPYLLPQTIFVGDLGRLVVPLGRLYEPSFVLSVPEELPFTEDLEIRRIELERRGASSRLLIDFVPYASGTLPLPDLEFLPLTGSPSAGGEKTPLPPLAALEVQVASILDPQEMALSAPASPLAIPGTSLLVYGTFVLALVILALGIGGSFWGRSHFREFWEKLRRRYLLRGMVKLLRRLRQECAPEKNVNPGHYLTLLSGEFREFLSLFTKINCRSLTAGEFLDLNFEHTVLEPSTLCRLFRTWDTLRFSGRRVERPDLFQALDETDRLIARLDRAEKERFLTKPLPDTPETVKAAAGEAS